MRYIIPDYYNDFKCIADKCEDTCCAGWQIMIDPKSLAAYKAEKGPYAKELRRGVDFKEAYFRRRADGRCHFLNEENLCEMYIHLGESSLCKTCTRYPRHVEEFEGVREMTLSVSCPEVARMLLVREEPVRFLEYEKEGEETYKDFDPFLYSILADARAAAIKILQNRELPMQVRSTLVLGMAHDMQLRVDRRQLFDCQNIIAKYETEAAAKFAGSKLETFPAYRFRKALFHSLYRLEKLKDEWDVLMGETEELLYKRGSLAYKMIEDEFERASLQMEGPALEVQMEQIWIYFYSTYFCGAVYDGKIMAKAEFAACAAQIVRELWMARWLKNEGALYMEEKEELLYRFSRELEHSDKNLELFEHILDLNRSCMV